MTDIVSISQKLKLKLKGNDEEKLEKLTDALLDSAIAKNTTAMKIVVDLVEPTKPPEPEPQRQMTDEELLEAMDQFVDRVAAKRDQPQTRS